MTEKRKLLIIIFSDYTNAVIIFDDKGHYLCSEILMKLQNAFISSGYNVVNVNRGFLNRIDNSFNNLPPGYRNSSISRQNLFYVMMSFPQSHHDSGKPYFALGIIDSLSGELLYRGIRYFSIWSDNNLLKAVDEVIDEMKKLVMK